MFFFLPSDAIKKNIFHPPKRTQWARFMRITHKIWKHVTKFTVNHNQHPMFDNDGIFDISKSLKNKFIILTTCYKVSSKLSKKFRPIETINLLENEKKSTSNNLEKKMLKIYRKGNPLNIKKSLLTYQNQRQRQHNFNVFMRVLQSLTTTTRLHDVHQRVNKHAWKTHQCSTTFIAIDCTVWWLK